MQKHTRAQIAIFTEAEKTLANVISIALSFDQTYQHNHLIQNVPMHNRHKSHQQHPRNHNQRHQGNYSGQSGRNISANPNHNGVTPMEIDNLDEKTIDNY